jgi:oligopeptide/dipeptide ABC transporter ATP-binding protein
VPRLHTSAGARARGRLAEIPGLVPSPLNLAQGCAFAARCSYATELCRRTAPSVETTRSGHQFACHHADRVAAS